MEPKERRTVVNPSDFTLAMDVVMSEHSASPGGSLQIRGKWCM
jgi:hypothetical protein